MILPPKMSIFVLSKNESLVNFVKFRQKSIFLTRRPVYVISSVFLRKRNLLESKHYRQSIESLESVVRDRLRNVLGLYKREHFKHFD